MVKKKFFRRKEKSEKNKRRKKVRNQNKPKLTPKEIEARKKAQRSSKFKKKYSKDHII